MVYVTWPRWPPCPYMLKTFSETEKQMNLKLGMQHRILEYYQFCFKRCPVDIDLFYSNLVQITQIQYGKFFFSSNTLAVRTPKIILKLLLKTFSFSSNSDFFHAFEFLILRTLKNARNNAWTSQNRAKFLGVLFSPPTPWAKRGNSIVSMNGVLLGLEVICGQAKNIL